MATKSQKPTETLYNEYFTINAIQHYYEGEKKTKKAHTQKITIGTNSRMTQMLKLGNKDFKQPV